MINMTRMIHMAETRQTAAGTWMWYCRCPEMEDGFTDRQAARKAGDKHLSIANAPVNVDAVFAL